MAAQLISTNGPVARGALVVNRARQQLLAGAGLAGDQHRDAAVPGDPPGLVQRPPHRLAVADDRREAARRAFSGGETAALARAPPFPALPLQRPAQRVQIRREREVVTCARPHRRRPQSMIG